jgi:hypothetical protein
MVLPKDLLGLRIYAIVAIAFSEDVFSESLFRVHG